MLRGTGAWVSRGALVVLLLGTCASGARASIAQSPSCGRLSCSRAGTIRWQELLPGGYVAYNDARGTEPTAGEPVAAIGRQVAVFGLGTVVSAYDAKRGNPRWTVQLPRLFRGGQIVSDRVWPGVVTVGVVTASGTQQEVVLSAATGRLIRAFPRAQFGGTVAADASHTVVVGPGAVTSYDNASGRAVWTQQTGAAPQRWQLDGHDLYVSVLAGGFLAAQPVTALRRIDLRSGAERLIRPRSGSFAGALGAALDGVVLFSAAAGVTAYSGSTGALLWHLPGAVPQAVDVVKQRFFLTDASGLEAVDTDGDMRSQLSGSAALYGERDGVAFGLDDGASGEAWGLDTASQRVIWTTSSLPWPHVFVDLSGIGGSVDPRSSTVILATCAQANVNVSPAQCARPELVAINR
ncbi:MAG TPA: PQQ-binding-like beta-propeller repeat protein [Streptosporangiaceae bacterium]|nr:PQQ-binding-like beta-propeller repeat protein [Streptosporangiaceae bacterium]